MASEPSPERAPATPRASLLTPHGAGLFSRAWSVCAKDAAQELRRRIALASVFFFAATALTLVSFAIGPLGVPPQARSAVSAAPVVLLGKTLFNFCLFLSIAAVAVPGFTILLEWNVSNPAAMALVILFAGFGLSVVSTFLSALVARASQKNVLFVVISFPLLVPLLLS